MKNTIITITILTIMFRISFAQQNEIRSNISGTLIDIETQQAIPFVNIWLEGTTIGTTSDENGFYTIKDISVGRYTLVVKMIGYEQKSIADITVVPKRTTIVNIAMQ
ncbi:MAG: carboxypeptidase-like regulatory domain-containing protein, partial [Bacteroidota bacterium]|nr:carboxypeptidase-like regulatory domain-containing protein [Bacteroidota bacterium]